MNSYCQIIWNNKIIGETATQWSTVNPLWGDQKNSNLQRFILPTPLIYDDVREKEKEKEKEKENEKGEEKGEVKVEEKEGESNKESDGEKDGGRESEKSKNENENGNVDSLAFCELRINIIRRNLKTGTRTPMATPVPGFFDPILGSNKLLSSSTKELSFPERSVDYVDDDDLIESDDVIGTVLIKGKQLLKLLKISNVQTKWFPIISTKKDNYLDDKNGFSREKSFKLLRIPSRSPMNFFSKKNPVAKSKSLKKIISKRFQISTSTSKSVLIRGQSRSFKKSLSSMRLPRGNSNLKNTVKVTTYKDDDDLEGEIKIKFGFMTPTGDILTQDPKEYSGEYR